MFGREIFISNGTFFFLIKMAQTLASELFAMSQIMLAARLFKSDFLFNKLRGNSHFEQWMWKPPSRIKLYTYIIQHSEAEVFNCNCNALKVTATQTARSKLEIKYIYLILYDIDWIYSSKIHLLHLYIFYLFIFFHLRLFKFKQVSIDKTYFSQEQIILMWLSPVLYVHSYINQRSTCTSQLWKVFSGREWKEKWAENINFINGCN